MLLILPSNFSVLLTIALCFVFYFQKHKVFILEKNEMKEMFFWILAHQPESFSKDVGFGGGLFLLH